jgi:hypothetical protein
MIAGKPEGLRYFEHALTDGLRCVLHKGIGDPNEFSAVSACSAVSFHTL